ncbi:MAG: hypothetical protein ACOYXM_04050 [Actinomycetota bacterium]
MSNIGVTVGSAIAKDVLSHLRHRAEMVAFMRGAIDDDEAVVDETWLVPDDAVTFGDWHVALTDEGRQNLMRWAVGATLLIEVHSHGEYGGPAAFSATDLDGLAGWVPHLTWRLPGLSYVALVLGAGTFDGLAWLDGVGPHVVGRIHFSGEGEWTATGRSISRWNLR